MTTANGILPVLQVVLLANYHSSIVDAEASDAIYYVLGTSYIIYTTFIIYTRTN
jgi:hypothetical protein